MGNKRFNWGILGPGRIANQFAEGLKVIEDASLFAIGSKNLERGQAFAKKYQAEKVYNSYEALVNDPEVDAVYIATPHRFHFDQILLCLNAGKPVLCEKPLTVNAAETKELVKVAIAKNTFLMEAFWTVYLPIYAQVRQWLNEKVIGDLRLMDSTLGINVPKAHDDRWLNPELAGGTLLDMGVYPISVSQWVMGREPQSFSAKAYMGKTGVDELTAVILKYENGVISTFSSNFISDDANNFYIYGSKGHICIHGPYWGASRATLVCGGQELTVTKPLSGGGFEFETEEAMRCFRQGLLESPLMTHAQTVAKMSLMDSIRFEIGLKYPFEK